LPSWKPAGKPLELTAGLSGAESSSNGDYSNHPPRVLLLTLIYHSSCGYSTAARQQRRSSKAHAGDGERSRQAPYDFTGCCAHADITYGTSPDWVVRIIGYFDHNEGCQNSSLVRYPSIPLHEHVYEVALQQLAQGARCVLQWSP